MRFCKSVVPCVVKYVVMLGCLCAFSRSELQADIMSLQADIVASQRAYCDTLKAKNAVDDVPAEVDMRVITRDFAAKYLPASLFEVDGNVTLAMDDRDAKIGSLRLKGSNGTDHVFTSWVTKRMRKPFCWMGERYPANSMADRAAVKSFLIENILAAQPESKYIVKGTATPIGQGAMIHGVITHKPYSVPFERAYLAFVDDNPLANWGHAARLVFIKDDLTAFVVWYLSEPVKVVAEGVRVTFEDICGNVELPPPPTIDEIRNALKAFDDETGAQAANIRTSGGDTSHSYAILISGGGDIYNNHTRYWGDMAAVYSTLTRKYGIPKSHIKVCMSDGTSSAADVSYGYSSSSHGLFSRNSSPLDLDGDGSADVGYSATKSSIQSAFSSFRNSLTSSDQLFVFATDHGDVDAYGNEVFCVWGDDDMYVSTFAALTSGMSCRVAYAFEFCYSGAFINALKNQGGIRVVATAASVESSSAWTKTSSVTGIGSSTGLYYMNPWTYYFVGATRGYFPEVSISPWNDGRTCSADTSGDGRVSILEASNYASSKIRADGYPETPNYGESSSGAGASFFLVKNLPSFTLASALDVSGMSFTTGGDASWSVQTSTTHDGTDAARSGVVGNSQSSWMQTTVSGAGTVSFWWRVSSEANYDKLKFIVDGSEVDNISGTGGSWTKKTHTISSAGSHTIKWQYSKDGSMSNGEDAGYVDQVTWTPATFTVTLYKNDGTTTRRQYSSVSAGNWTIPSISSLSWSRSGYTFLGWSTSSTATSATYSNGQRITVSGPTTLYAVWRMTLPTALDNTSLRFTTGGSASWFGQTSWTHDGTDAARSGAVGDSQSSWLQTTVSGPGTMSFWWRVSSESGYDHLKLLVDGTEVSRISGTDGTWAQKTYSISSTGTHTIKWQYSKDGSWSRGLDAGFVDQVTWTPRAIYTVTFNANGGSGSMASQKFTQNVSQRLTANAFWRLGYTFAGWATSPGGSAVYADGQSVKMTSSRTLYATWNEIVAGRADPFFSKVQTPSGALYRGGTLVGTVQVKFGKVSKKNTVKVSATATILVDGRAKKVTAKAVEVNVGAMRAVLAFRAPIGSLMFEARPDGTFTLRGASYFMASAAVGGVQNGHKTFTLNSFDLAVPGTLVNALLPYDVAFVEAGGKWQFAKAAGVRIAKNQVAVEGGLRHEADVVVVDDSAGKTNLSALKLTYTAKTGFFKGTFRVYAVETSNGRVKLVKFTVNVAGFVINGRGYGEAASRRPAGGPWTVTVK